jgi:hypothetical protein
MQCALHAADWCCQLRYKSGFLCQSPNALFFVATDSTTVHTPCLAKATPRTKLAIPKSADGSLHLSKSLFCCLKGPPTVIPGGICTAVRQLAADREDQTCGTHAGGFCQTTVGFCWRGVAG